MYEIPALRFGMEALEPWIDAGMLRRHHEIHHPAYTVPLNAAMRDYPALQGKTIEEVLRLLPGMDAAARAALQNLAGGHANHQFQWKVIGPGGGGTPGGALAEAIEASFGSFAGFRDRFIDAALAHVGAGWAYLAVPRLGTTGLEAFVLPGNDSVLAIGKPGVLICDLWEHAYDAQYPAARADYLEAFFHVIDWSVCGERFESFSSGRMHVR